jgi:hypothetical protein
MAKYELEERTELNGQVWYHIKKDDIHVDDTYTQDFNQALEFFDSFKNGKQNKPIIKILKTIDINEDKTN